MHANTLRIQVFGLAHKGPSVVCVHNSSGLRTGDLLRPRTFLDWQSSVSSLGSELCNLPPFNKLSPMDYTPLWFCRAILVPWMRAAGIPCLLSLSCLGARRFSSLRPFELAEQVVSHMACVPDESEHLLHLSQAFGASDMSSLGHKLGYDGPLELLSMWLCLFGNNSLSAITRMPVNTAWLQERALGA